MVQLGDTDGRTAVAIAWRTKKEADSRVDYEIFEEKITAGSNERRERHTVILNGLLPSTCYPYRAQSNGEKIGQGQFCTFKSENEAFGFVVFGDSGFGRTVQYSMAKQITEERPDFILHTGDLVYPNGAEWGYRMFFYNPYRELIHSTFFFPSMGNHDARTRMGRPLLNNFRLPNGRSYYRFIYANTLILSLDSTRVYDQTQTQWLENELRRGSSDKRIVWKIVFFHHPPYSNKTHYKGDCAVRKAWVPLFEKYGVDIVFSGHNHLYTRLYPKNGVVYIIEGVGGRAYYRGKNFPDVAYTLGDKYGFGRVQVRGKTLRFSHLTHEGDVVDSFEIQK